MKLDLYRYDFKDFESDSNGFDILVRDLNITNDNIITRDNLINDDGIKEVEDIERIEINPATEIITINN